MKIPNPMTLLRGEKSNSQVDIEAVRHTLAHLLASSVLELYPGSENSIGPSVEYGFYQDFEIAGNLSTKDLPQIEERMREKIKEWHSFEKREVSLEEAHALFPRNKYKRELAADFAKEGRQLTLHNSLDEKGKVVFLDLCKGGHVENPSEDINPESFHLTHIAGAYWRGSDKNKMLTRIYGLAFGTKGELEAHMKMLEEAKKRDHRILGPQLDLFVFSDLVGSGLPLWTPRGTLVRNLLDSKVWQLRKERGYLQVDIPHITRKDLYVTSGHWDKYKDDLFRITTRDGHEYAMKPMNCPHHTQIYARKPMSYRELPQRYASTTKVYRDEQTGELSGLARVLAITQDDAHVFCRMSQARQEFLRVWDIVEEFYKPFGFELRVRLSMRDPEQPEKYLGKAEQWDEAQNLLRDLARERKTPTFDGIGEAAFYGPKLDFMGRDAIGREHQVATIQFDFNMPERFDLTCVSEKGEKERVVMIHAAIMGSIERCLAVLIEHTAGNFPFWLSPLQVKVLPITDTQHKYAKEVYEKLASVGIRAELDMRTESLGKKIRDSKLEKTPYLLVIGEKEMKDGTVTLEARDAGEKQKGESMSVADLLTKLSKENNP
jgi:threonyl-tRNA synthetase